MMPTSTLVLNIHPTASEKQEIAESGSGPAFATPSAQTLQNILNYSRSLEIKKSAYLDLIEVVKS